MAENCSNHRFQYQSPDDGMQIFPERSELYSYFTQHYPIPKPPIYFFFFFLISAFIEDDYITQHESPKLGLEDGAQQGVQVSSQQM